MITRIRRRLVVVATAAAAIVLTAGPAAAAPDPERCRWHAAAVRLAQSLTNEEPDPRADKVRVELERHRITADSPPPAGCRGADARQPPDRGTSSGRDGTDEGPSDTADPQLAPIEVSPDGHFLQFTDGRPFFWLADTGWEMFHRASREDARLYLDTRAEQGFTVIQAVALAEKGGLDVPTPAGHTPLLNNDPATPDVREGPDNDYWDDVDYMIDYANSKGMYVALWAAWGSMVHDGPEVLDTSNARAYGEFLGARYGEKDVFFVLGGDRESNAGTNTPEVWSELAAGIRATDPVGRLISYHPWGEESSTEMFPNSSDVIDFNLIQGSHKKVSFEELTTLLVADYGKTPTKPVIDSEVFYEEHPFNWNVEEGWKTAVHARGAAYYQVFSGAAGHTYGDGAVHQFWEPGMDAPYEVRDPWQVAINHEGATQMHHLKDLILSRPSYFDRVPDQSLIVSGTGRATRATSGDWALIYLPEGGSVEVDTAQLASTLTASWFNPRTGETEPATGSGSSFTAPDQEDWVLVLGTEGQQLGEGQSEPPGDQAPGAYTEPESSSHGPDTPDSSDPSENSGTGSEESEEPSPSDSEEGSEGSNSASSEESDSSAEDDAETDEESTEALPGEGTATTEGLPSDLLALQNWFLTLPIGPPNDPDSIDQPELLTYKSEFFQLTPEGDGVVFRTPTGGVTTKNSKYPRSELREMAGGDVKASWSSSQGVHTLETRQAITETPVAKPEVVSAQIHDGGDDVMQIRLEGQTLVAQYADGKEQIVIDPAYQLGTPYDLRIVAENNVITVFYNGARAAQIQREGTSWYFKIGSYVQSNPEKGDPDAAGEVVLYSLNVTHEGAPAAPASENDSEEDAEESEDASSAEATDEATGDPASEKGSSTPEGAAGEASSSSESSSSKGDATAGPETDEATDNAVAGSGAAAAELKIMPLGSSSTLGKGSGTEGAYAGYRAPLYDLLTQAGVQVDFVGSQSEGPESLPDHDHEGHSGWCVGSPCYEGRMDTGIADHLGDWLTPTQPDVILLYAGGNDISAGVSGDELAQRTDDLLNRIFELLPNAHIVLGLLFSKNGPGDRQILAFNAAMPTVADQHNAAGHSVTLVDLYPLMGETDFSDGTHLNEQGYRKMAEAWMQGLSQIIRTTREHEGGSGPPPGGDSSDGESEEPQDPAGADERSEDSGDEPEEAGTPEDETSEATTLLAAAERADDGAIEGADVGDVSRPRRRGTGRGLVVGVARWSSGCRSGVVSRR